MKIRFNVEYQTTFGEDLVLNILSDDGSKTSKHKMTTLDGLNWFVELTKVMKPGTYIDYYYSLMRGDEEARHEWLVEPHRLEFAATKATRYTVYDHWLDIPEDAYLYSSAFTDCVMVNQREMSTPTEYPRTVRLKVRAPQLRIGEHLALAKRVTEGGEAEREDYFKFLKSGGSRYPIESLKVAGVDMSTTEPVQAALDVFADLVSELEKNL